MAIPRFLMFSVCLAAASSLAGPAHDFGCLTSGGDTYDGGRYSRAVGPVFEWRENADGTSRKAILPFFVRERDARGRDMTDILWPVGTISRWEGTTTWRFLTAFGYDSDNSDPESRYRVWVLPVLFWGRNAEGGRYAALFPIGGRIDGFLGRDISFVLFPLYSHSRINDLDTRNYLWPIVSRTRGRDVSQFRVFPFYGRSVKSQAWDKTFVLWPFWNSARYEYAGARGRGYVLFPVFGHVKLENQETWMVIPPFFRHSVGAAGREGYYPWPFIQTSSGRVDKLYVWPLYGNRAEGAVRRQFWLWPFVWRRTAAEVAVQTDSFRVFPLFYTESSRLTNAPGRVTDRYTSVWPLVSYHRAGEDRRQVRVLDLWPFRDTAPIERCLAPWWTLYRHDRGPEGRRHEVLWGMAHWESTAGGRRSGALFPLVSWDVETVSGAHRQWDFLKGLVGYERHETECRYRLLYVVRWRVGP